MQFTATESDAGKRLDVFLQGRLPEYSRSRLQQWIREGRAAIGGTNPKPSFLLRGNETIEFSPGGIPALKAEPEDLPVTVLYEDDDVIAVDKAAGMVVHAGAGCHSGTLVNALLHRYGKLSGVGGELRPGIVHRIDRFTSGVLLVARTDVAHRRLAAQFAHRKVQKTYLALVHGEVKAEQGSIETPIARDPVHRARMTARLGRGRTAVTDYRVRERIAIEGKSFTLLEIRIGTGRTHQIRVHMASIGHPVAGDRLYGAPSVISGRPPLGRYFLHAHRIVFTSPSSGREISIESPLPQQLEGWIRGTL